MFHPLSTNLTYIFAAICIVFKEVDAYYCDNDKCSEEEYCCGENVCCPSYKVLDIWYLWWGVLLMVVLLLLLLCLWRARLLAARAHALQYAYAPLATHRPQDGAPDMLAYSKEAGLPPGCPPAYSPAVPGPPPPALLGPGIKQM